MDSRRPTQAMTITTVCVVLVVWISPVTAQSEDGMPCSKAPGVLYPYPDNCNLYQSCEAGVYAVHQCPTDFSFSPILRACVQFNSLYDTCTRMNPRRACADHQNEGVVLTIPHYSRCHNFYTCNTSKEEAPEFHTCDYPDMFDMVERRCKSFKEAFCGPYREEYKDYCGDYRPTGCIRCRPCRLDVPSCKELPDGFNVHPEKPRSPFYILCDTGRFLNESRCPFLPANTVQLFYQKTRQCTSIHEIPQQEGGYKPSCQGLKPGFHKSSYRFHVYFHCPDETVYYCNEFDHGIFLSDLKKCIYNP